MADSAQDQEQQTDAANFAFHEPAFVDWWLGSLYLLPLHQQLEVAQTLRHSIHKPQVLQVLDEFIGRTAAAIDATGARVAAPAPVVADSAADGEADEERPVTAKGMLAWMWRRSPAATCLGFAGIGLLLVKSVLALFGLTTVF